MTRIDLTKRVHAENDVVAGRVRDRVRRAGLYALNLISSPGAGKTTLVAATAARLGPDLATAAVVGDLETDTDAGKLRAAGLPAAQIETLGACHLTAAQVERALDDLPLKGRSLLAIENVGNLVCPNTWDLGEDAKVVLVSLPEGHDKAVKYPTAFAWATAFVVTKVDLAPVLDTDVEALVADATAIHPDLAVFRVSAKTGEGMDGWTAWLRARIAEKRAAATA